MKSVKKWALVLCVSVAMATNFVCSGTWTRTLWTAAINGAADFVEQETFDLFIDNIGGFLSGD